MGSTILAALMAHHTPTPSIGVSCNEQLVFWQFTYWPRRNQHYVANQWSVRSVSFCSMHTTKVSVHKSQSCFKMCCTVYEQLSHTWNSLVPDAARSVHLNWQAFLYARWKLHYCCWKHQVPLCKISFPGTTITQGTTQYVTCYIQMDPYC
jgi:hypothetical protein